MKNVLDVLQRILDEPVHLQKGALSGTGMVQLDLNDLNDANIELVLTYLFFLIS